MLLLLVPSVNRVTLDYDSYYTVCTDPVPWCLLLVEIVCVLLYHWPRWMYPEKTRNITNTKCLRVQLIHIYGTLQDLWSSNVSVSVLSRIRNISVSSQTKCSVSWSQPESSWCSRRCYLMCCVCVNCRVWFDVSGIRVSMKWSSAALMDLWRYISMRKPVNGQLIAVTALSWSLLNCWTLNIHWCIFVSLDVLNIFPEMVTRLNYNDWLLYQLILGHVFFTHL